MVVLAGKEVLYCGAERMVCEVELINKAIGKVIFGVVVEVSLLQADVKLVIPLIDPAEGIAEVRVRHQDAEAIGAYRSLDGPAPR